MVSLHHTKWAIYTLTVHLDKVNNVLQIAFRFSIISLPWHGISYFFSCSVILIS